MKTPFQELIQRDYQPKEKNRIGGMSLDNPALTNTLMREVSHHLESPDKSKAKDGVTALKNYRALAGKDLGAQEAGNTSPEITMEAKIANREITPSKESWEEAQTQGIDLVSKDQPDPKMAMNLLSPKPPKDMEVGDFPPTPSPTNPNPGQADINGATYLMAFKSENDPEKKKELLDKSVNQYQNAIRPDKVEGYDEILGLWPKDKEKDKEKTQEKVTMFKGLDALQEVAQKNKNNPNLTQEGLEKTLGKKKFEDLQKGLETLSKNFSEKGPGPISKTIMDWAANQVGGAICSAKGIAGKLEPVAKTLLGLTGPGILLKTLFGDKGDKKIKDEIQETGERVKEIGNEANKDKEKTKEEEQNPDKVVATKTSKIIFQTTQLASKALPPGLSTIVSVALTITEKIVGKAVTEIFAGPTQTKSEIDGTTISPTAESKSSPDSSAADLPDPKEGGMLGKVAAKGAKKVAMTAAISAKNKMKAEMSSNPENRVPEITA